MPTSVSTRRFAASLARIAALVTIAVLVCVPAATRVGQPLQLVSHGISFSKNIDCPPKKVTVAPLFVAVCAMTLQVFAPIPMPRIVAAPDVARPRSLDHSVPSPLRAPPSALLA